MKKVVGIPFQKGRSGNPGGRPKGIAAKAREHGDKALQVLATALEDDDAKVRIAAARELLDRGYGKALTMTADVSDRLDDIDDDTLGAAIDALREAAASTGKAGGGKKPPTAH